MKSIVKLSILISIIFVAGCKSDKSMNKDAKAPIAEKQAKELSIHNSTRTDNYFWMRLTDEQKTASKKDKQTQTRTNTNTNTNKKLKHI